MTISNTKRASNTFSAGDILVVPPSNFLPEPAFFRVIKQRGKAGLVQLRALGCQKNADGSFAPTDEEHYDSLCEVSKGKVVTWCGNAEYWEEQTC